MESILNEPASEPAETWNQIAPMLDGAMEQLGQKDHNAVVLRFFEGRNFKEVGAALGASEDAAKMRVNRALDKLRKFFTKRGVISTTAIIAGAISGNSVQAAPVALAKSVTAVAIAKGVAASGSTLTLITGALKLMAWTKAKMAIVVGITAIALTLGAGYFSFFHKTHPNQPGKRKLPVGEVTPVISFGRTHGVILASDGSLWAWGENDLGWPALGLDNIKNTAFLNRIGNENDWVSIAVGESHNLAIKADGTVWAWGENIRYELGDGTRTARSTPVRSVALNDWKQAASGLEDSFLIKNDGTLWAWGLNNFGQLGSGDFKASPVPVQIGSAIWKKVWAGFINAAGLQSDGSLWVWGGGPSVGNTTTSPKSGKSGKHYSVPTRISPDTNWVDVAVSVNVVFTIKSEGTLWAWGYDAPRYTGDANNTDTLIQVGAEHDWQTCSCCGSRYLVLIKKDGSLWSLSSPDLQDKAKLKRIDLQKNIVAIGGGGGLGAALTRDGEVWTWGKVIGEQVATIRGVGKNAELVQPTFTVLDKPWQLSNLDKTA